MSIPPGARWLDLALAIRRPKRHTVRAYGVSAARATLGPRDRAAPVRGLVAGELGTHQPTGAAAP